MFVVLSVFDEKNRSIVHDFSNMRFLFVLQPVQLKSKVIGKIIGKTSRTTLTKYMKELVDEKILMPKKIGVEVYYLNNDLIRILEGN
jgi:hypothetical protein